VDVTYQMNCCFESCLNADDLSINLAMYIQFQSMYY
jgi:hypothetical protein